jgi:hypothetical protein
MKHEVLRQCVVRARNVSYKHELECAVESLKSSGGDAESPFIRHIMPNSHVATNVECNDTYRHVLLLVLGSSEGQSLLFGHVQHVEVRYIIALVLVLGLVPCSWPSAGIVPYLRVHHAYASYLPPCPHTSRTQLDRMAWEGITKKTSSMIAVLRNDVTRFSHKRIISHSKRMRIVVPGQKLLVVSITARRETGSHPSSHGTCNRADDGVKPSARETAKQNNLTLGEHRARSPFLLVRNVLNAPAVICISGHSKASSSLQPSMNWRRSLKQKLRQHYRSCVISLSLDAA